jgi:hypothetical protein
MQQDGKKSMKSVFMSKQKLKGLTSSPADSTFSPISRQFLRRDEKRGIMKKTNIQRVIAERKKSLNNDGKCKFFESKINGHNGASSKHEHVMYENTGTTHTLVSSPFPPHRQGLSIGKQTHKTPRQLPSLGGINKKNIVNGGFGKYSSPSDMLLSPASKAFTTGTIGLNGKLQKGNVRKLIALKSQSRLSNNVSTTALNKK